MLQISLTAARVNAKLTLDDVAKKLHKTKQTIVNWEKGKTIIDVNSFNELCALYEVPNECIILPNYSTQSGKENDEDEKI